MDFPFFRGGADLRRTVESLTARIGQLQSTVLELESGRSQIEGILQSMAEGVLVVAPNERLLLVNRSARQILELPLEAGGGTALMEAVRQPELVDLIRRVLQNGRSEVKDVVLYAPLERDLEARAAPCEVQPLGRCALLVFHDVTELRRLERMRTEFVANVSHELKTPLTTIQGAVETLLDGAADDPKNRRAFLEAIREESERLHRLVEDLLTLASVESRRAGPARETVEMGPFLRELLKRYDALARRRQIALSLESQPGLPPVRADRDHLVQAIGNLLDNAIKYNRAGGSVALRARREGDALAVEVEDTGIGIPPEDLPRIFERFYRVDKARSRETGGTGLGLSIVKHVAEAHGGSVSVESRPGQGSRFTLKLPL
ncbi:MAG: PAS domain-containing protein [Candidatus Omnitrophica bacterium]|nr:PAS domain-containing protein [Candidatus Omnitrophota bacterium]